MERVNLTDSLMRMLDNASASIPSAEVEHQIKRCLLDYTGVVLAGQRALGDRLKSTVNSGENGPCTVIGTGVCRDLFTAAVANGFAAHFLEMDDGNRIGAPHLEAPIISTMIAIAQKYSLSPVDFMRGIIVGYEATIRLSSSIQPGHKLRGFHSTGTCGTIGVASAIAYAMGYSRSQIKSSISAASSSASGLLQIQDDGSQLKPYNVANAIVGGITAAMIGKCDFACPDDMIGGNRGFMKAFAESCNEDWLIGNRTRPDIFGIYVKPYAACRHAQAAIDCAMHICADNQIDPEDIYSIEIQTYKLAVYGHDQIDVSSGSAAKMSIPYCVAAAIVLGSCGIDAFEKDVLSNEMILRTAAKIRLTENNRLSSDYPLKRGSIVTITLNNGIFLTSEVEYPLGEPENNISDDGLLVKYHSMMQYAGVEPRLADDIAYAIWHLEDHYTDYLDMISGKIILSEG